MDISVKNALFVLFLLAKVLILLIKINLTCFIKDTFLIFIIVF